MHEWAEFAAQTLDMPVQWREAEKEVVEVYSMSARTDLSRGLPDVAESATDAAELEL